MFNARDGIVRTARIVTAVMMVGALCMPAVGFAAPDKKQAADAKADGAPKKDPAAAERSYAAGTKAYEAGNLNEAVQQLSAALANGGLPNPQMAKALYYRGTAYRKQGKPAQAISDLTTAVWLKGGLSDSDRAQAMEQRQLAYSEAGLGSQAPAIGAAPLDAPAAKPVQQAQAQVPGAAPPPAAPKPGVLVATVPPKSSFFSMPTMPSISMPSVFGGGSSSAPAPAPQPAALAQAAAAPAPVPAAVPDTSWQTATATAEATPASIPSAGFAVSEPAAAPASPPAALAPAQQATDTSAPSTLASTGSTISGFFGGIFGGGSGSSTPAPTTGTPPSTLATGSTGPTHGDTPWDGATVVAQTSSMVQRGPEEPPAPLPWSSGQTVAAAELVSPQAAAKPARSAAQAGKYKLQVAAVRSREEAEKLAASLNSYQAVQTGAVQSEIDEAVIGSMGTFYRVRLGPYADAKEPGQLCKTLKPQGFDCMVVTQ